VICTNGPRTQTGVLFLPLTGEHGKRAEPSTPTQTRAGSLLGISDDCLLSMPLAGRSQCEMGRAVCDAQSGRSGWLLPAVSGGVAVKGG